MIFYFSGTGNNRWLAQNLSLLLDDTCYDIMKTDLNSISLKVNEVIGFVFPIYAWGVPKVMLTFIKQLLQMHPSLVHHRLYAIGGCGENVGNAFHQLQRLLPLKNIYSIAMPNNYVLGSELDSDKTVQSKLENAKKLLKQIAHDLDTNQSRISIVKGSLPWLKTTFAAPMMAKFAPQVSKGFYADDRCTSCGLCVTYCAFNNIVLKDGRPQWQSNCNLCLACINRCPYQAIQHGKNTSKRSRYYLPPIQK